MNEEEGSSFAEITPRPIRPVRPMFETPLDLKDFEFKDVHKGCCNACFYNRVGLVAGFERDHLWTITICVDHLLTYPQAPSRDKALFAFAQNLWRGSFECLDYEGDQLMLFFKIYHLAFSNIPYSIWFEMIEKV